jgi:hypothetical protein
MQSARKRYLRGILLFILVLVPTLGNFGWCQGTNGTLTGLIADPTGAAIPGAAVVLTNVETNAAQNVTSDKTGVYLFSLVPPGRYQLAVTAPGFGDYKQTGIIMAVNLNATQNVNLKVGSGTGYSISVEANAQLIDTTSGELGTTINEYSVAQLPLNGRDPSSLALLAPGVVDGGKLGFVNQGGFSFPGENAASANGGRQGSIYYMLDGISNMDNYQANNSPTPNADAVQEFRLISNNFSAIYGFSSGGVVSLATKSGTNKVHGGLFEFWRNQDLNAKNWNSGGLDPLKRHQFGGYIGAPIIKDKLFGFFNYQGTRSVGAGSSNQSVAPTQQMLTGDFSGLVDYAEAHNSACGSNYTGPQTTACGWLRGPFVIANGKPNQLVGGAAALDPVAVQVTNDGLPGRTAPAAGTGNPTAGGQNLAGQLYYSTAAVKLNLNEYTGRLDYDVTSKQRITLRSYINDLTEPSGDVPGNVLSVLNLSNWSYTLNQNLQYYNELLQHTWTINPRTVNTISGFFTEQTAHNAAAVVDHSGKPMCWSRYINVSEAKCDMEGAGFGGAIGGYTEPSQEVRTTFGFSDTLLETLGRHNLAMGIDLQRQSAVENTQFPINPSVSFGGNYTGNGQADWLLGYMSGYYQGAGEIADVKGWLVDPYINDEFRILPNLTLTAGIRWDPDLAPSAQGRGAAFVAGRQSSQYPNAPLGLLFPGDTGVNNSLRPNNYGYFEPRIGIAYQPRNLPHTSLHAAFGLFSGPVAYSAYNHTADVAPFSPTFAPNLPSNTPICFTGGVENPNGGQCNINKGETVTGYDNFHNPWQTSSWGTGGVNPFPPYASIGKKPAANSTFPTQTGGQINLGASFARNFKAGITQSWNFSVEQQFGNFTSLRVAYVGSESYHQSYIRDANFALYCSACNSGGHGSVNPYPQFNGILEDDSAGTASYNSVQVSAQRQLSHGFQGQTSFTWQKTIDLASTGNPSFGSPEIGNPFNLRFNRGVSALSIPFGWVSNFLYVSPAPPVGNPVLKQLLGGWQISPIITLQSGTPFSISGGNSTDLNRLNPSLNENNTGSGCKANCSDRADRVAGQPLKVRQGGRSSWLKGYFNTAAFMPRADGTFGNSAKNLMYGPPTFNVDASLAKNFSIRERYNLQFRFEMFNALNHPIMSGPDTNPSDSTFGQINGGNGYAANASRVGQAAAKFTF